MSANNYKAAAVISIELDAIPSAGKSMVCATLVFQPGARPMHSFSGAFSDAQIVSRLPEWLAELRAEVALGRFESLAEERATAQVSELRRLDDSAEPAQLLRTPRGA